jgi:hypothetical protein
MIDLGHKAVLVPPFLKNYDSSEPSEATGSPGLAAIGNAYDRRGPGSAPSLSQAIGIWENMNDTTEWWKREEIASTVLDRQQASSWG